MWTISSFAVLIGCAEPALRLILSIFAGYPMSFIYRQFFYGKSSDLQHLYFTLCGICILYFNYVLLHKETDFSRSVPTNCKGTDVYHSLISVTVAFVLCNVVGPSRLSVGLAFVFYMTYLTVAYWVTATDGYDIFWTIPQCILTLRLIGLVFDCYDGSLPVEMLSPDQKTTRIKDPPGFLEIAAYTYFYGSLLVGPQFPLTRFRKFVSGEFADPDTKGPPKTAYDTMLRLSAGIGYLLIHQMLIQWIPTSYLYSDEFKEGSFLLKMVEVMVWFRVLTCMYLAVWLIVEGICIYSGLAHNGVDENGVVQWDGLRNFRLRKFEFGHTFHSLVEGFNINTNIFASRYVFKRLRFLGSKELSQVLTLLFLAVWHGCYSGYYVCFAFEFVCVVMEKQASDLLSRMPKLSAILFAQPLRPIVWLFQKAIVMFGITWGVLSFALLTFDRWWTVFKELYFVGWLAYGILWPLFYYTMILFVLPRKRSRKVDEPKVEVKKEQ